jgi:hypothetical protein
VSVTAYRRLIDALDAHDFHGRDYGDRAQYQCPAHEDRTPSLSITDKPDRVLVCCRAGCDTLDALARVNLDYHDLFDEQATGKGWMTSTLKKVRARTNGDGRVTLGAVGYMPGGSPKTLAVAGSWRDLWPDPSTINGTILFVVEGEPDAVTAAQIGLPAVAIPGAAKFDPSWPARLAEGRDRVVIIPDADEPGRKAAQKWKAAIEAHCHDVQVLDLDPDHIDGRDLSDYCAGAVTDADRAELRRCIRGAVEPIKPSPCVAATAATSATSTLLSQIREVVRRYVVLPGENEEVAVALFVAHTWAFAAAHATPYIVVQSPEKQSGKTRLLEVVSVLVCAPLQVASASEAALYRTIEMSRCTLLLDEVDAIFAQNTERTEALRGLINSGNRASGRAIRCVGQALEPKVFSTFCPKVLAGIDEGRLPDTITDRAIEIRMKRKLPGEGVQRFRERSAVEETAPLLDALRKWAAAAEPRLADVEPGLPDELSDRAAEAWEPLLAIADDADQEWSQLARTAALDLSGPRDDDDAGSVPRRLLAAIRKVWPEDEDRTASADLCRRLNEDDELPYCAWSDGKGINPGSIAKYIKPYGISSASIRIGDATPKGFMRDQFDEAWARYLPPDRADVAVLRHVAPTTDKRNGGLL